MVGSRPWCFDPCPRLLPQGEEVLWLCMWQVSGVSNRRSSYKIALPLRAGTAHWILQLCSTLYNTGVQGLGSGRDGCLWPCKDSSLVSGPKQPPNQQHGRKFFAPKVKDVWSCYLTRSCCLWRGVSLVKLGDSLVPPNTPLFKVDYFVFFSRLKIIIPHPLNLIYTLLIPWLLL
jgi:hypothetical protein